MIKLYSNEDVDRLRVIQMYLSEEYTRRMGAMNLGITERQFSRIVKEYNEKGPESVIHGNTGRKAVNRYPDELRQEVCNLYTGKYGRNGVKLNFCHFYEKLDCEGIDISYSTTRRILIEGGIKPPNSKPAKDITPPRPRRFFAGELLQVDGSTHNWLYHNPHLCTLHGSIDDATSIVTGLWFEPAETMHGYQMILWQTIKDYGIPKCFYTDNRNIFNGTIKSKTKSKLNSPRFRAMLTRLSINVISTSNSRAKGRVERVWRTLQDRLYNELQLRGISTIDEANAFIKEFLPEFNKRFASAIIPDRNAFRAVPADYDYNQNLALMKEMKVHGGCYLALNNHYFVIKRKDGNENKAKSNKQLELPKVVQLHQFLDGSYHVFVGSEWYELEDIGPRSLHREITSSITKESSKNSPWRQFNPNYLNKDRAKWDDENLYKSPFA